MVIEKPKGTVSVSASPVLARIGDVISPEAVEADPPVPAVDVLLVVDLMLADLPCETRRQTRLETRIRTDP